MVIEDAKSWRQSTRLKRPVERVFYTNAGTSKESERASEQDQPVAEVWMGNAIDDTLCNIRQGLEK